LNFIVKNNYYLDLLNYLNILTDDQFYTKRHLEAYNRFSNSVSQAGRKSLSDAVHSNGNSMLGPLLSLLYSAVPDFEDKNILEVFGDLLFLKKSFAKYPYYNEKEWFKNEQIIKAIVPVVTEIEQIGFREYWENERLSKIINKSDEIEKFITGYDIGLEIAYMLGSEYDQQEITLYLCSFAAPHGMKLCGPRYVSDISFSNKTTLAVAIHEMFHPPYHTEDLHFQIKEIGNDNLVKRAFANQNPNFGYDKMEAFIEENVVEAMALYVCGKIGVEKDPYGYLEKHDEGSHVLSYILLNYFDKYPKVKEQSFHDYFIFLVNKMPIGNLTEEYLNILKSKKM
jgi:hypothetical protein